MSYSQYLDGLMSRDGDGNSYVLPSGHKAKESSLNNIPLNVSDNHLVASPTYAPPVQHRKRRSHDPNRPKRPTSAYFYFIQLEREAAVRRGEKITRVADWTKSVSAKWRLLTNEDRLNYNKLAASDKIRYSQQMAAYTGKDANRPKRPQSAYIIWLAQFRENMKAKYAVNKELLRAAGEEWRRMSFADKYPYEQLAEQEKLRYGEAMKDYNNGAAKKAKPIKGSQMMASPNMQMMPDLSSIRTQEVITIKEDRDDDDEEDDDDMDDDQNGSNLLHGDEYDDDEDEDDQ